MCTAISFLTRDHYFGRNLDYDFSYHETVTITPRRFPLPFRHQKTLSSHYAMIGMAFIQQNYPLYYDATNEKGLSIAGLNFPGNATYQPFNYTRDNITPFELIPWILGQCATVKETRNLLSHLTLVNENFSDTLPLSPLHFMVSDRKESLVIEPLKDGLKICDNPIGVLTNNPTFDYHLTNLINFRNLTREEPKSRFAEHLSLDPYSRGMGAIGLPGDLSSASRFVRAAFVKLNSVCGESEEESLSQFFHILSAVEQPKGCCRVGENFEYTIYSSCCNTDRGVYYYTTYENRRITGVDMHRENLDGDTLISYPLCKAPSVQMEKGLQNPGDIVY